MRSNLKEPRLFFAGQMSGVEGYLELLLVVLWLVYKWTVI